MSIQTVLMSVALAVTAFATIFQLYALRKLVTARRSLRATIKKSVELRARLDAIFADEAVSHDKHKTAEALHRELVQVATGDVTVIERALRDQGDDTKVRFAKKLVA